MRTALQIFLLLLAIQAWGQSDRYTIRSGNSLYDKGEFALAEEKYNEVTLSDPQNYKAWFNRGAAQYRQDLFDEAITSFDRSLRETENPLEQSAIYHNIGNIHLKKEEWKNAVDAYKNALRKNPNDEQTRENLAYAMNKLQQGEGEGGEDGENQENQDQEGDQNKDGDQQNDENKEGESEQQKGNEGEEQQNSQKPGEAVEGSMTREEAERLLEAIMQQEQKVQDKLKQEKLKGKKYKQDKDW